MVDDLRPYRIAALILFTTLVLFAGWYWKAGDLAFIRIRSSAGDGSVAYWLWWQLVAMIDSNSSNRRDLAEILWIASQPLVLWAGWRLRFRMAYPIFRAVDAI